MIAVELNSGTIGYMEEWVYNLLWPIIERLPDELLYDLQCENQGSYEKYRKLLGPALKDLPEWEDGYSPKGQFELRESVKEDGPFLGDVDDFVEAWEEMLQQMFDEARSLGIDTSYTASLETDGVYNQMRRRVKEEGIRLNLYVPEK